MIIACIISFAIGVIVALIGWALISMKITGMTFDEMSEFGYMGITASQNRTSTVTLCTDDGYTDIMLFEEKE